jgi:4-carboxymuconolactone decarboxylase
VAGPRGGVIGPFIPALRSPELMRRLQRLGEYLRYANVLGPRLTELAILLTARAWTQQLEWGYHAASAAEQGIPKRVIAAIARGKRPARMARKDAVVYEFFMALERKKSVGDAIYARAVAAFGEAGVIDLIGVIGYYTTLAMILNVARTPPPKGAPRLREERARSARGVRRAVSLSSQRRIQVARRNRVPR